MRRCAVLCFVFVTYAWTVLWAAGPAIAQAQLPAELQQKIDKAATEALTKTDVPSASVAVVKDGQIAYVHAYGNARLDPATRAKPEMRYSIGSISKQFTATAMAFAGGGQAVA